jgi:hypothetical protein
MELPINPSDESIEHTLSIEPQDEDLVDTASSKGSEKSSISDSDPITKWIEKKELFIQLERDEDAKQTEQALSVLPIKVRARRTWNSVKFPLYYFLTLYGLIRS